MQSAHVSELWRYPVKSMAGERLDRSGVGPNGLWGDRGWAVRNTATGEIHNAKRYPALMQCAAAYRTAPHERDVPHVVVTFPDGAVIGSESPELAERLSHLMGHRVTLAPLRPASDTSYYRRHEPGTALIGRVARSRIGRRLLQWGIAHGAGPAELRLEFGREPDEPMPDLTDVPPSVFEFYTPPGTYFDVASVHVLTTASLALMARLNPSGTWDVRRFRPNVLIDVSGAEQVETRWVGRTVRIGGFAIHGEMPTVRCAMPTHPQKDLQRDSSVLRTIVREANQCLGLYASVARPGTVAVGDEVALAT